MLVIASNITTRNRNVAEALRPRIAESISQKAAERIQKERADFLQKLAKQCVAAGADVLEINLQQRYDEPEIMQVAVETIQSAADCQLCLSAMNSETLEVGMRSCRRPPIVNYISLEGDSLNKTLPLAAKYNAEVVIFIADSIAPSSIEDYLKTAFVLVGAANESGIPNNRIIIDPGVLHVTTDLGQNYTKTLLELTPALAEAFSPPIRTTCWINKVSAGAPRRLRAPINNTFLAMLAAVGLSSAFVDVLNMETMRTIRLTKILRDEVIYSDRDSDLKPVKENC